MQRDKLLMQGKDILLFWRRMEKETNPGIVVYFKYVEDEKYLVKILNQGDVDEAVGVKITRVIILIDLETRTSYDNRREKDQKDLYRETVRPLYFETPVMTNQND